jgi:hypothetical protein
MSTNNLIPLSPSPEREGGNKNTNFNIAPLLQERGWGEVEPCIIFLMNSITS